MNSRPRTWSTLFLLALAACASTSLALRAADAATGKSEATALPLARCVRNFDSVPQMLRAISSAILYKHGPAYVSTAGPAKAGNGQPLEEAWFKGTVNVGATTAAGLYLWSDDGSDVWIRDPRNGVRTRVLNRFGQPQNADDITQSLDRLAYKLDPGVDYEVTIHYSNVELLGVFDYDGVQLSVVHDASALAHSR